MKPQATNRKASRPFLAVALALTLALPRTLSSQAYTDIRGGYFGYENVLADALDKRMAHEGKYFGGLSWQDTGGKQTFFLSTDHRLDAGDPSLHAYQYTEKDGKLLLAWDAHYKTASYCGWNYADGSLQVIDLDGDGEMEVAFAARNACDDQITERIKLLLVHKGAQMAIEGKVDVTSVSELERSLDPSLAKHPKVFQNFMLRVWNEYFQEQAFAYSYSVAIRTGHCLVLEKEYLMASGGTSHALTDLDGTDLAVGPGKADKIAFANSLHLMPDGKCLLYAGLGGVGVYDPVTGTDDVFVTFLENTAAISGVAWSPDRSRFAFTALNTSAYPQHTRIFVITLDGNAMARKDKYDARLIYMAAADWVVEAPGFRDDRTLEYTELKVVDNGPAEGPVRTIALSR